MKIILVYPDLGEDTEEEIIDWLKDKIADRIFWSPLKYVEKMEVER